MSTWNELKEKGNKEFQLKNYSGAITCYTQGITLNSNEISLYGNRATCFKILQNYKKAIRDFKQCLEIEPRKTKYIRKLVEVYLTIGNFGEAQMLLQKCINLEPRDSSHTLELNKVKTKNEEFEKINSKKAESNWIEVEELSEKMLTNCPGFTNLKLIYIEALIENVKIARVIDYIEKTVTQEEKENNEEFNYDLARAYYYNGDYSKAKSFITMRLEKKMDDGEYENILNYIAIIKRLKPKANDYFKATKYNEAIAEYTQLIEVDPLNKSFLSIIYSNRSLCYIKQKKFMEALKDTNQAIKLNPFYSKGYFRRGNVYFEMKMFDDARSDYQKVQQLEPNNKEISSLLQQVKEAETKGRKRNYYKILGLETNASTADIKKAYRKMALKWHPDRNGESDETKKIAQKKFIDINDAYSILSDPKKKEMYDSGVDPLNPDQGPMGGHSGFESGSNVYQGDPNEIFKVFFSGNGQNGTKQTMFFTSTGGDGNFGNFSKMFSSGNFGGFSEFLNQQQGKRN